MNNTVIFIIIFIYFQVRGLWRPPKENAEAPPPSNQLKTPVSLVLPKPTNVLRTVDNNKPSEIPAQDKKGSPKLNDKSKQPEQPKSPSNKEQNKDKDSIKEGEDGKDPPEKDKDCNYIVIKEVGTNLLNKIQGQRQQYLFKEQEKILLA